MTNDTIRVISMAACPQSPYEMASRPREGEMRRPQPSRVIDVLTISDNPTLAVYLSGLFQESGWTIARARTCATAMEFVRDNPAAVAVCEAVLPDGTWSDAAVALSSIPDAPALVVIGDDESLVQEVLGLGGFDALVRPLRESDVVWTIGSAWHAWMKRFESRAHGGPPCSGA